MLIRLEPTDPHWIRLNDPDNVARDIGEWWENNATSRDKRRATIDIKIPEVIGVGGKARIRWYSNDWHYIGLSKSKDGKAFTEIWGRSGHYTFDQTHEIELDPECEYYRIHFSDGNGGGELTRVYKDIEVIVPTTPTPTPTPTPVPQMDKETFLSKIKGKIDGDAIGRPPLGDEFKWWTYGGVVWFWGKTDWQFAVGIVFGGKYFGCDNPANPPTSAKCILFYDENDNPIETQDETICNAALAALPYVSTPTPTPAPVGDITRVELDSELLPENGTLDWIVNEEARVKVYFKNVGNAAGEFRIEVAYNGDTICDLETDSVPADGREYYVDDCVFTPDATGTHTIKVTITP